MKRPEQALQIAVAQYLEHALKPPTIWTAFPAGGGGRIRGAFLKAMGLKAGWPDILVIYSPDDRIATGVLGIELKAKAGRQTPAQQAIAQSFKDCHAWYVLCRSVDEVERALRFCKVPLHASAGAKAAA